MLIKEVINVRLSEIDRRGVLKGIGTTAMAAGAPMIAKASQSEPIVQTNDPKVVQQALNDLKIERQRLLNMKKLFKNPTPEMLEKLKTWSPNRLASFETELDVRLTNNQAFINRGEDQLAKLSYFLSAKKNVPASSSTPPTSGTSRLINKPDNF